MNYDIDSEILDLVNFIDGLEGVKTFGSCQGHNDGGPEGKWFVPYIKFKCTDNRTLALLASIEYLYSDLTSAYNISKKEANEVYQPMLNALWTIEVVTNYDHGSKDVSPPGEYALYVLNANSESYKKPSDVYPDFQIMLDWYKSQKFTKK